MIKKCLFLAFLLLTAGFVYAQSSEDCLDCHDGSDSSVPKVTPDMLSTSSHAGFECTDCHESIEELPHEENLLAVQCGNCHEEENDTYRKHGVFEIGEDPDIPTCSSCHGSHDILPSYNKESSVHPLNLPQTCGTCHENLFITKKHTFLPNNPIQTYKESVHGKATQGGIYTAATCNDCHSSGGTAHKILAPGDSKSTINHFSIPDTCGKCHQSVAKDYWEGIHGQLTKRGETDSPVCTNCHGEHNILKTDDTRSPVNPTQIAEATCAPCHESALLTEKYGLPAGRLASFVDSYHGLKSKAGDSTVANCSSCHGAHRILNHNNPTSSIHVNNLQETCGECHPGITQELATTKIHEAGGLHQRGWPYFFTILYYVIITVTLTGMILYIAIDFYRQTKEVTVGEQWKRMNAFEVIQHGFLALSFIVLVITGFALRFAESWWVDLLFGREGGFPLRNTIHRIAAVVLILTSLSHVIYMKSKRGQRFLKDIFPSIKDIKQAGQMIAYNIGFGKSRPAFGRFSYVEKFEYWALVWGTIIMSVTGLALWFDNFVIHYMPKGVLDVILIIHYYEAWLAFLSILIWHLYSTIFNPGIYPMNPSWITGKMPKHQFEHEHAEFAKEMAEQDKLK